MARPRRPRAVGGNGSTAPKMTKLNKGSRSDKKNQTRSATNEREDGGGSNIKSKRQQRSIFGFFTAIASCGALIAWLISQGVYKRRRDRKILDGMLSKPLVITEHAACRMDCRFITRKQIEDSLQRGVVNDRKSEPSLQPCPKYVVDAALSTMGKKNGVRRTKNVQGVFAACPSETRVLTVIDTATNWPCGPC
jgi:hypothetical protein